MPRYLEFVYPVLFAAFWLFFAWAVWSIALSFKSIARSLQEIARHQNQQHPPA